ncbi:MAG: fumarate hydratase [Candidatus Hydrothermarchaeaceae archaeon]
MNIADLIKKAVVDLPMEVENGLREALEGEESKIAKLQLRNILENVRLARELKSPLCQDTGLPIFFVRLGNAQRDDIKKIITEGIRDATRKVPLRPNVVDPLSRKNTGDNTGARIPEIHWDVSSDNHTYVTYMPKGAGSENASSQKMLKPTQSVTNFVLDTVKKAGGSPCPPILMGIGIGGTMDSSAYLAKKALLRPMDSKNSNEDYQKLEDELLKEINNLGIGPMGLGGRTTALKVNIEYAACHTASLPVAVNIQCWAHRYATMRM